MRVGDSEIAVDMNNSVVRLHVQRKARACGLRPAVGQRGFTLIELIMIIVIVGIVAVVATSSFNNTGFNSRGFADQVQASLRYAQKTAIAQRGTVCVRLAAGGVTLSAPACGGAAMALPTGGNTIVAPNGVTLAPAVDITFDALGSTPITRTISITGVTNNIIVEAETGYVHSP